MSVKREADGGHAEYAMSSKPKYCPRCGAAAETQERNDRQQEVCVSCDTPVFDNPPPLAAAVVLNDRREVLLVKCKRFHTEPIWCLPMDAAAAGESMEAAARRILKKSAGLEARAVRMLNADFSPVESKREQLIVTYEFRKTGGQEKPGPLAERVAYFPPSRHPQLVLPANEKALQICVETHQEEWMIRDSFERLQSGDAKVMLSDPMIAMINSSAAEVAQAWLTDVRQNPSTPSYAKLDQEELLARASCALSQFGCWLSGAAAEREIVDFYVAVGRERQAQGFTVYELFSALTLLKKHVWTFARDHGAWERPIDVYSALELSRRIAVFFDKLIYHTLRGFAGALNTQSDPTMRSSRNPRRL